MLITQPNPEVKEGRGAFPPEPSRPAMLPVAELPPIAPAKSTADLAEATRANPQHSDELPAVTIYGRHQLVRRLGGGGMGVVYQSVHQQLGRSFAVKILRPELFGHVWGEHRLRREGLALGKIQSPHVVESLDAGEEQGIPYLVMELVDGLDLGRLLTRCGPLSVPNACEVIRQAAFGLADMQQAGFVHRDLKPSNLMLARDGYVKILDLGLARLRDEKKSDNNQGATAPSEKSITGSGEVLGTVDYLSPQQALDPRALDIRNDLYSLGCTLFKLLTGRPPYYNAELLDTNQKRIQAHLDWPIPLLRDFRQDASPTLQQVLERLLAKQTTDRYDHPLQLADALTPLITGANLSALLRKSTEAESVELAVANEFCTDGSVAAEITAQTLGFEKSLWPKLTRQPIRLTRRDVLIGIVGTGLGAAAWVAGVKLKQGMERPEFESILVPGDTRLKSFVVDKKQGTLDGWADGSQLIRVNQETGRTGEIRVTFDQVGATAIKSWWGWTGIFLGLRPGVFNGKPVFISQCLWLSNSSNRVRGEYESLQLIREKSAYDPHGVGDLLKEDPPSVFQTQAGADLEWPGRTPLELRMRFTHQGILSLSMNGIELPELYTPRIESWFSPADYAQPMGLFSRGRRGNRFRDIHFCGLE